MHNVENMVIPWKKGLQLYSKNPSVLGFLMRTHHYYWGVSLCGSSPSPQPSTEACFVMLSMEWSKKPQCNEHKNWFIKCYRANQLQITLKLRGMPCNVSTQAILGMLLFESLMLKKITQTHTLLHQFTTEITEQYWQHLNQHKLLKVNMKLKELCMALQH